MNHTRNKEMMMCKEEFEEVAKSRGLPFLKKGMRIKMGGERGIVKDFNYSGNLKVLFDGARTPEYCNPKYDICYFGKKQEILADFRLEKDQYKTFYRKE